MAVKKRAINAAVNRIRAGMVLFGRFFPLNQAIALYKEIYKPRISSVRMGQSTPLYQEKKSVASGGVRLLLK
jgi:hypothetical protein